MISCAAKNMDLAGERTFRVDVKKAIRIHDGRRRLFLTILQFPKVNKLGKEK